MTENAPIRVAIAEDSALLRDGLVRLLRACGFEVTAACPCPESFLAAVDHDVPDLVVVDVRMPPTYTCEGVQAATTIRGRHPDVAVMVLSQYVEEQYATELVASRPAGVGYLLKDRVADPRDFVSALREICAGGTVLDPEVVAQLLGRATHRDPLARLTARERDVLALMAQGRSNTAIAEQLTVSDGAVGKHISSIFTKLDLPLDHSDHRRVLAVLRWLEQDGARR
ncbi:MAG: DNA-binding response regulator [Micrococcales bacterium]|nr:MAG: DNA-binding response regulator [Micrococcales bacterium]PIE27560.1 MAG: DNA-binding response regulator [Micrococcales bacterium]